MAAAHLYYLMTSDSYSRYLRSSHYKDYLEGAKKKSTRSFPGLPKLTSAKLNNMVNTGSAANGWNLNTENVNKNSINNINKNIVDERPKPRIFGNR